MPQSYLSYEKRKQFTELFSHFDYYSTGTIHYSSLVEILKSMSIQMEMAEIQDLLADVGNTNKTMIKLDQFLAICSMQQIYVCSLVQDRDLAKQIQIIFKIFDADKNGTINKQDIKKALTLLNLPYNEQQINNMLKVANKKELTFQQFQEYILKDM